jgi:hypothetical protein
MRQDDRFETFIIIKGIKMKVMALRVKCQVDVRMVYDLLSVISQDLESHGMTNMFSNANKVASPFTTVQGKTAVINCVVDGFVPLKL